MKKKSKSKSKATPEYKQALQELIKYEIQALVERLADTGEEAIFITACISESTCTTFGSSHGQNFLGVQKDLGNRFLTFCTDKKQGGLSDFCTKGISVEVFPDSVSHAQDSRDSQSSGSIEDKNENSLSAESFITEDDVNVNIDKTDECMDSLSALSPHSLSKAVDNAESAPGSPDLDFQSSNGNVKVFKATSISEGLPVGSEEKPNKLLCSICNKTFSSYESFSQHVSFHTAKSHKCPICGKMFYSKKSYGRHLDIHTQDDPYSCQICDKIFSDRSAWKRHKERHSEIRPYPCHVCGKAFYEKYSLRVHQTSHFLSQRQEKPSEPTSGFSCHNCQKNFQSQTTLNNHLLTHSAKKYSCEFCNKRFAAKFSYIRHRRIHTGEKPYRCQTCDKAFTDGSAWSKHVRTHTGIKPYSCGICGKSFFDKTTCKIHTKTHEKKEEITRNTDLGGVADSSNSFMDNLEINMDDKEDLLGSGFHGALLPPASEDLDYTDTPDFMVETQDEKEQEESSFPVLPEILENVTPAEKVPETYNAMSLPIPGAQTVDVMFTDRIGTVTDKNVIQTPSSNDNESDGVKVQYKTSLIEKTVIKKPQSSNEAVKSVTDKFKSAPLTSLIGSILKCQKCFKAFKNEEELRQHRQFQCLLKFHKCRICGKRLATKQSLDRHVRIHTGERRYKCSECEKTFVDYSCCIRHVRQHCNNASVRGAGSSQVRPENTETNDTFYKCNYCGKIFTEQFACERHLELHTVTDQTKVYQEFQVENVSVKVEATEDQQQPTVSSSRLCGRPTDKGDHSSLINSPSGVVSLTENVHVSPTRTTGNQSIGTMVAYGIIQPGTSSQILTNTAPLDFSSATDSTELGTRHECEVCHKTFKTRGHVSQHMLYHREKKFKCPYCGKMFHSKYGFDRHCRIHTGEKPYSCPTCQKAFSDNSACAKHVRTCRGPTQNMSKQ